MAANRSLPALTSTGRSEHVDLERNVRNALDQMRSQYLAMAASDVSYTPTTPSNWSGTAPTTVQQALDRLAAACVAAGHTP